MSVTVTRTLSVRKYTGVSVAMCQQAETDKELRKAGATGLVRRKLHSLFALRSVNCLAWSDAGTLGCNCQAGSVTDPSSRLEVYLVCLPPELMSTHC